MSARVTRTVAASLVFNELSADVQRLMLRILWGATPRQRRRKAALVPARCYAPKNIQKALARQVGSARSRGKRLAGVR